MKTRDIKKHMFDGGLQNIDEVTAVREQPSNCWSAGGLSSETVVESFTVTAPDRSEFLVTITKLKG